MIGFRGGEGGGGTVEDNDSTLMSSLNRDCE